MRTLPLIIVGFILVMTGCAEKPKSIGGALIDPNDVFTIADTTVIAQQESTYTAPIIGGFSNSTLAGRIAANEELIGLYKFTATDAVDSLTGAVIDTAEIRLYVNYSITPASPPIILEVREAMQSWSQNTFNTDSMKSFPVGGVAVGTFSDSMNVGREVIARIDTALVRRWVAEYQDTVAPDFHGFAVQAPQGTTTGVIGFVPFGSFTSTIGPRLVIKYTRNGTRDSIVFSSGEDTHAALFTGPPVLSKFEVRGAFGIRAKVNFNFSAFTDKPIVNNAVMTVVVDTANSRRSVYSPDSLIALLSLSADSIDQSSDTYFAVGFKTIDSTLGQTYRFTVSNIVQRWINNLSANEGLSLRWAYETNTADRIVLYPVSDPLRAPRITIIYSKK
ncbi:MAG: hypothetical protein ACYC09_05900 [Bacteroidota bacterium]